MAKAGELVEATVKELAAFRRHELTSHRELYEIIRLGDPRKATQAMIDHIEAFRVLIVRGFLQAEGATTKSAVRGRFTETTKPYGVRA